MDDHTVREFSKRKPQPPTLPRPHVMKRTYVLMRPYVLKRTYVLMRPTTISARFGSSSKRGPQPTTPAPPPRT